MNIELNKDLGLIRVGLAVVPLRVADIDFNINAITGAVKKAAGKGVQILAFPEMAVTGYTIGDLIHQEALLNKAKLGLFRLLNETAKYSMTVIAGIPLQFEQRVYNCAVVMNSGKMLGVIPKTFLPNYKEFYEGRYFTSSRESSASSVDLFGQQVSFGTDLLFKIKHFPQAIFGVEICEDLWVPLAPHEYQALAGATLLFNISASNEILGKSDWRRTMVSSESGRCISAYCYVSSGIDESSNDVIYSGHALIAENGRILKESTPLISGMQLIVSDIDLEQLVHDRQVQTSFHDTTRQWQDFRIIEAAVKDVPAAKINRELNPHPFVPSDKLKRAERCRDIFSMQVAGLAKKLSGAKKKQLVLGVSGGLDSTLALLVAVKTMDFLDLPAGNIHTYTLPGFGTTPRTLENATALCKALEVDFNKVDINHTCKQHLKDIRHDFEDEDVVFENVQARYRTEFLFNTANHLDAVVLGTGDLTEIALGWATFSGDHISHYHVNASVPKTLVQYLIRWVADEEVKKSPAQKILYDVLDTPISPELKRAGAGQIIQKSEDIIGPVELADFYLYPFVRFGMRPGKILFLANEMNKQGLFNGKYTLDDLNKWLKSFIQRFFANQFKRNCFPEGPKVGSVSLSPRGDWRMPSDADPAVWLEDLKEMYSNIRKLPPKG